MGLYTGFYPGFFVAHRRVQLPLDMRHVAWIFGTFYKKILFS